MKNQSMVPQEKIESKIYLIRGKKVMLDRDLALLYRVETRTLNQAVKRNPERFPEDFMFRLSAKEVKEAISRSQFVILKHGKNIKYSPYAFTEQGVAMLSSVLNSRAAIFVNIEIIRTFVRLKETAPSPYKDLWFKIDEMEKKYDKQFQVVFKALKLLLEKPKEGFGNKRF